MASQPEDIAQRLLALSPEKRALLARRLEQEAGRFNTFPLSFAQERLWLADRMEPGSPAYNIPSALRLTGALDAAALERALGEIVRRHELLRTSFPVFEGRPMQVVNPARQLALEVEDVSALPAGEREAEVERRLGIEVRRPFDLAQGNLVRAKLLRLSGEEHVFLLTIHHIVGDAWSMGVFVRELTALYEAFSAGRPSR